MLNKMPGRVLLAPGIFVQHTVTLPISMRLCADKTAHTCTGSPTAAGICVTSIHEMAYRLSRGTRLVGLERRGNSTTRGYGINGGTCRFTIKSSTEAGFYLPVGLVVGTMTIKVPGVALYKESLRMTHDRASRRAGKKRARRQGKVRKEQIRFATI